MCRPGVLLAAGAAQQFRGPWCVWVLAVLSSATLATAGHCEPEVLVPLDTLAGAPVLRAAVARRLPLFADYPGLREVRLYRLPDGSYALELHCQTDSAEVKFRDVLDPLQGLQLRRRVAAELAAARTPSPADRSGRTRFLVRSFLLSYGFYSWALPLSLDLHGRPARVTSLVTGSAGFFVPYSLTRDRALSKSQAQASGHFGLTGIAHGVLLSQLAPGDAGLRRNLAAGMGGSIGGLVAGLRWAQASGASRGTADLVGWAGNCGLALGAATADLGGWLDHHCRAGAATMLAGSALGYWGGQRLAARVPHSSGDVEATVVTAGLGAYTACALVTLADIEQHRAYSAAAAAGLLAGGWLGEDRFAGQGLSTDQARLALLGAGGGLLLGVATHLVVAPDAKTVAPLLSALGADTGFWLVGRAVARPRGTKSAAARVGLGPAVMRADRGRGQAAIVPALRATWVLR